MTQRSRSATSASGLSTAAWQRCLDALEAFEQAFQRGDKPNIDGFLAGAQDEAERRGLLIDLVHAEMELRLKAGQPAGAEVYFDRFPELRDAAIAVELIAAEFAWRSRQGTASLSEFVARFSDYREQLQQRLERQDERGRALPAHIPAVAAPGNGEFDSSSTIVPTAEPTTNTWPRMAGYEINSELGRGGMGVVYLAHDLALDRDVAVKTLNERHGVDAAVSQRFLVEAKITGQLQHPGIPAVHELGRLPDGRPFLAMKLVRGQTLRALLQMRSDPGQDRGRYIAIFEQICQALGYAHAHRVIHRDLKPTNVMVGAHGEVQVMDWGLAKVLGEQGTTSQEEEDEPVRTGPGGPVMDTPQAEASETKTGQVIGTPAYMPPEQAGGQVRLLDPRSDVFGLGAILCEILTGQPPYRGKSANEVWLAAVRGELADAFARLEQCGAEPELTVLCQRCLAFRQEDRPADGETVAAEVGRIRQAAEDRARQAELERERALVRALEQRKRRRVVQLAAGLIAAVLLVGLVGTTWALIVALRAADAERQAREQAQQRLAQIERGVELFAGLLTEIDPRAEEKGGQPLYAQLREQAEKAADQLQAEAVADPLAVARLQTILGKTLHNLGSNARAIEVLQRARATREQELGADHPDTLGTLDLLAQAYQGAAKLPEALALFQQVSDASAKTLGADDPFTLTTQNNLAQAYYEVGKVPEAIALYEQVRDAKVKKLGADHPSTLATLNGLAVAYKATGNVPAAIALYEQVRDACVKKLGPDHLSTLITLNNLAGAYHRVGKLPAAIALYEQIRATAVKKLGFDHPLTLIALDGLAGVYHATGKQHDAIALYEQVRAAKMKKLGADHPSTLSTLDNLAVAYQAAGKLPEAVALFHQVRDGFAKKLGPDHPETLITLSNLAAVYRALGKLPEALPLFEEAAAGVRKLRFLHPFAGGIIGNTVAAYEAAKEWDRAESWRRAWTAHVKEKAGLDSPAYASELAGLGWNLLRQHHWAEAESVLSESLSVRQKRAPQAWTTFSTMALLGGALAGQNRHAEAEPLLLKGFHGLQARVKSIPPRGQGNLSEAARRLVELYRAMKKDKEASEWQQTLDNIVGKLQEPIHDVGKGLTLKNQLDATTKALAYQVRLEAGRQYLITMSSADGRALVPSLVLTDEENNLLAESGNSADDARIMYRAPRTAVYHIRAACASNGRGLFTLTVAEKKEKN